MNNDFQFTEKKINEFMESLSMKHWITSMEHFQTNGQVEVAKKVIMTKL